MVTVLPPTTSKRLPNFGTVSAIISNMQTLIVRNKHLFHPNSREGEKRQQINYTYVILSTTYRVRKNQKLLFGMSITLKLYISDPMCVKTKCVWKAYVDLENCKQTSDSLGKYTILKHISALLF